jgi:hypothetical protein
LRPHPELLSLLSEPADDLVERTALALGAGSRPDQLVEATPDGQVIFGYPSVLAARLAGLRQVEVVVREDLNGQEDAAVALAVIDAALDRGGLDKLGVVRCLDRAHQLRGTTPCDVVRDYQRGELDEQVAAWLGVSVRNAQRYLRVLETPLEVQQAFAAGKLPLTVAGRIAGLRADDRAELADAIRAGEKPAKAAARFVKAAPNTHARAYTAWRSFHKNLERGLADMAGRFDQVKALSPEQAAVVDQVIAELQSLRSSARVLTSEQQGEQLQALLRALAR